MALDGVGLAGMIAGFTVLGLLLPFSLIWLIRDQIRIHQDYNNKLMIAENILTSDLGLNMGEVDQEYEDWIKQ